LVAVEFELRVCFLDPRYRVERSDPARRDPQNGLFVLFSVEPRADDDLPSYQVRWDEQALDKVRDGRGGIDVDLIEPSGERRKDFPGHHSERCGDVALDFRIHIPVFRGVVRLKLQYRTLGAVNRPSARMEAKPIPKAIV